MGGNSDSIYVAKKSALLTNPTAATVFLQADNSTKAASVYFPSQSQELGGSTTGIAAPTGQAIGSIAFNVRAWGRVTGGTTTNFTPVIQFGVSTTAGSNTNWATGGAAAYNSASGVWRLDVAAVWDYTSKTVNGLLQGNNASAGTAVAQAATTQLTAVDFSAAGLGFSVSALFSASNAGNLAYLDGLTLELV